MKKRNYFPRILLFICGTTLNAFGITLITKAYLGTSPISSLPFVLSLGLPPTFGTLTFIFNMIFLGCQIFLLRRDFQKFQLLQIVVTIVFSFLIDLFMSFFANFKPSNYGSSLLLLVLGCLVMALGITMTINADLIMTPGNAFVKAIAQCMDKPYGTVEIYFDCTLTVLAVMASFLLFGKFRGVREGTIMSALLIGAFVNMYQRVWNFVMAKLQENKAVTTQISDSQYI